MEPTLENAQAIAADMEAWLTAFERVYGPQPAARHYLHLVQAKLENVASFAAGTIHPAGGTDKPGN